jgi:hypothetical protein
MDPASALAIGSDTLSLVAALAELTKTAKTEEGTTLRELLGRLQLEALGISRRLEERLRHLVQNYAAYGLNPEKSLDDQLADLSWYNFVRRSRLKSFRDECFSVYQQLSSFIDDATAVLICEQKAWMAGPAFKASLETKRQLNQLFVNRTAPVREILEGLLATASRLSTQLSLA